MAILNVHVHVNTLCFRILALFPRVLLNTYIYYTENMIFANEKGDLKRWYPCEILLELVFSKKIGRNECFL